MINNSVPNDTGGESIEPVLDAIRMYAKENNLHPRMVAKIFNIGLFAYSALYHDEVRAFAELGMADD